MLSTPIMTESFTDISILHNYWIMNITPSTASESTISSSYELDIVMLLVALDCQGTSTPDTWRINTLVLFLIIGSLA